MYLTPFPSQPCKTYFFIYRGNGDNECRCHCVLAISHLIIHRGNGAIIVRGRSKGIASIRIDDQRAHTGNGGSNTGRHSDINPPVIGNNAGIYRAIRVGAVNQKITTNRVILSYRNDFALIQQDISDGIRFQQWFRHLLSVDKGFSLIGGVKTGLGNGRITSSIDSDKTTITTRSGYASNTATTGRWSPTSSRSLKVLSRVNTLQNRFLQCGNI
ncbi:hypothetical protein LHJMPILO_02568 [Aeromonas veronii]